MLKDIRTSLLRGLKTAGVFDRVLNSRWRQNRILILCYHSVAMEDEHLWRPAQFLTVNRLRERLEILQQGNYRVLHLGDALERFRANDLPPRSVVLTFDDGTYDFYRLIYPLLKEFKFPATVYQTTHYCLHRLPVFPLICSYMLWKRRDRILHAAPSLGLENETPLATHQQRDAAIRQILAFTERRKLSSEEKNVLAGELAHSLSIDYQELLRKRTIQLMTPDEIAELAANGIQFELHTHRHRVPRDQALFFQEIDDNRSTLEAITKTRPTHFCYPSGDYESMFLPWLSEKGVVSATTCEPGVVSLRSRSLLLPRFIDTTGQTALQFESWLTGMGALLASGANAASLRSTSDSRRPYPVLDKAT
jgi:peptidoglycan/xylan/chitin deacetylase (PgdA/CDA1 family)